MRKFSIKKLILLGGLLAVLVPITYAATGTCSTPSGTTPPRAKGLVTSPSLSDDTRFYTDASGRCIVSDVTAFVPFRIPTFDDLKSIYYTQSKASKTDATPSGGDANQGTLRSALNTSDVVLLRGNLRLTGNLGGTPKTAVVFVDGNLSFDSNFTFGNSNSGIVFVVGGNVFIDTSVTQVDAVIISSGVICTASSGNPPTCPTSNVSASQLVINGSLISLNSSNTIKFRRSLGDNTTAAEVINHQAKYLVILRHLLSQTLQKWSEIP